VRELPQVGRQVVGLGAVRGELDPIGTPAEAPGLVPQRSRGRLRAAPGALQPREGLALEQVRHAHEAVFEEELRLALRRGWGALRSRQRRARRHDVLQILELGGEPVLALLDRRLFGRLQPQQRIGVHGTRRVQLQRQDGAQRGVGAVVGAGSELRCDQPQPAAGPHWHIGAWHDGRRMATLGRGQ
jgi:hypothetical protein